MRRLTLDWQPIETAPKDQLILLCSGQWSPCIGRWLGKQWVTFDTEGVFQSDADLEEYLAISLYQPTHWHPLPLPPEEDE